MSWTIGGDALLVRTREALLTVAASGAGARNTVPLGSDSSELPAPAASQTAAATAAVREAVYDYAMGSVHAFEGRPAASRAAFKAAAAAFSGLMWQYPLAGFSSDDALAYAESRPAKPPLASLVEDVYADVTPRLREELAAVEAEIAKHGPKRAPHG